jgi:MFS family permease
MNRLKETYQQFSPKFWILVMSAFIDRLGGTIVFPFFSLYITQKFQVGMADAGILLGTFSLSGFIGSMVGGALADRLGRKVMVLFGLVFSALSSIAFGLINSYYVFFILAAFVGFLSDIAGPAHQAMVADLVPEPKRSEGFGIMRVVSNLAWIIGPTIGGLLAGYSYMLLFVLDAITSLIVAVIVFRLIPETKPEAAPDQEEESFVKTLSGYFVVTKDRLFVVFVVAGVFTIFGYGQIYNTLSVFLRDVHGMAERSYGFLMSANATLVVVAQLWVTKQLRSRPPMLFMALGTLFYVIGLVMYGFVATYGLFMAAMMLITIGEMIVIPLAQALVAQFAPEHMRGRYMAFFGISWILPSVIGPWLSGLILDGPNPQLLWYVSGISCTIAIFFYLGLHARAGEQFKAMEAAEAQSAAS